MKLAKVIQTYVAFKRSMGMHFHSEDCLLRAFCRAVGGVEVDISNVKPAAVQAFLKGKGPVTAVWGLKFRVLRSFYRFAWCAEVRAIPFKKTAKPVMTYLDKSEIDAMLNAPDQRTEQGVRDTCNSI